MFRRRVSRAIRRMGRPNVLPMLQHANQLMLEGRHAEAMQAFEQLAHGAEERYSERAPFLYLEAGRAAMLAGQNHTGVAHFRRGLTLLASQGRHLRMQMLGGRTIRELRDHGLTKEAEEIERMLSDNIPPQRAEAELLPDKKPVLPTHCPNCGGAVRPDEVEWLDDVTAECAYCGSPVRGPS
ncbi:MAG: hypothetical protein FJZ87_09175 [Chloroflexi bacterium]|nr:hypothetical protein [Chloroflexota bacterium]